MTDLGLLKAIADRGIQNTERRALQRFDWLQKALDIFVAEGIDAVRITRLAQELGVTRGSFYWHFENRKDLIEALVNYWKDKNTAAITESIHRVTSLEDGIFNFFETCIDAALFDPRLDLALREWARRSASVRALLDSEDEARIKSLCDFFIHFGYEMPHALIRARILYYSQIGFYALEVQEPLQVRLSYTEAYFEAFTGKSLDAGKAQRFCKHILDTYGDKLP